MQKALASLLPKLGRQSLTHRVLRVDHAGEYAAYKIYAGQIAALQRDPVCSILQHLQNQETEHLCEMERLCAKHQVRKTVFTPLYHFIGFGLGYVSGILGVRTAMGLTVAVEELIAKHYSGQIEKLVEDDPTAHAELLEKLSKFRDDEIEHHDTAVEHGGLQAPFFGAFKWLIQAGCKTAIAISSRV
ncbi:unnamed protein product [Enterobius vermicularis]|uniref:5-demethoxyubiquinone hydroxylase, mitochondrial n=1 Tax=Enterobius vermicularis TaxID=51028 RepID=A0A0N4V3Q6_ENTVE|nr:unnamed protein product [Enterobius vermicularis]